MSPTKFQNSKYNVSLLNTLIADKDSKTHIVTKNIPFLLMVNQKNTATTASFEGVKKENISIKLVYESDLENKVNSLKTNPLDYNIYIKDQSITVETRIQTLSSKHENNLFRIIIAIDGKSLFTESIRCVSKITSTVVNTTTTTTNTTTTTANNNNNNTLKTHIQKQKQQITPQPSHVIVKKTTTNNLKPITELSKTIRKLKKLRQNDKNLISLLYQQNKLITSQLNSVTTIVNSLVSQHNTNNSNNNNNINNNDNNNMFYQQPTIQSSPTQEAPVSPFSCSQSSPPTPFVVYNQESNLSSYGDSQQEQEQQMNYQFPTIDADILQTISTDESCYSYPSDVSSFTGDYQQQQQESINNNYQQSACSANNNDNSSIISTVTSFNNNEVRLIDNQLKSSSSSLLSSSDESHGTMIDETIYSHPSSTFTFGLDFNLLGSQNNFISNRLENQVI